MKEKYAKNLGYKHVKERVENQLLEKYINDKTIWKHKGGKLHKLCNVLFWITSVLTLLTVVLNAIIIYFAAASNYKSGFLDLSSFFKNNLYIVVALFILYVVSMVLKKIKKPVISAIFTFIGTGFLGLQYFQIAQGGYQNKLMIYYIPAWIMFIASLVTFIIILNDKNAIDYAVNKEIAKIYNHFSESEEEILITQEDWDELLVKYEQQELYKEKNIKKAKKALENAIIDEIKKETE